MNTPCFSIEDFEPFFKKKFQIELPANLKPPVQSTRDLNLSEEVLLNYEAFEKIYKEVKAQNRAAGNLYPKQELSAERIEDIKSSIRYSKNAAIYWLAN
ncbi:MAG: hypothetical protein KDC44_24790, partial [Phaeodactylibacter sp.]|nr:hypothetical protein [Phaeodactylibacter sp.]